MYQCLTHTCFACTTTAKVRGWLLDKVQTVQVLHANEDLTISKLQMSRCSYTSMFSAGLQHH